MNLCPLQSRCHSALVDQLKDARAKLAEQIRTSNAEIARKDEVIAEQASLISVLRFREQVTVPLEDLSDQARRRLHGYQHAAHGRVDHPCRSCGHCGVVIDRGDKRRGHCYQYKHSASLRKGTCREHTDLKERAA